MTTIRLPGLVDPHVHLREPGATHKEDFGSGTRAAIAGGITTVLAMPNTNPPLIDSDSLALAEQAASLRACCDYGIFLGASEANVETAAGLAPRVAGLKFYLDATFGTLLLGDLNTIRRHFERWPKDRPILCHAEERTLAAVLLIAQFAGRGVHICHVSRRAEIELIRDAKMRGIAVTCEVAPHHLFLSTEDIERLGPGRCEVRPRLASPDDVSALWENIETIDCFATDHAPHLLSEKDGDRPPPGFPGLEEALPLLLTAVSDNRLALADVVTRMSDNPRRIFSLPNQPDTVVEIDPEEVWIVPEKLTSRAGWSVYQGRTVRGRVQKVVLRGRTVFDHGDFRVEPGDGRNVAPCHQRAQDGTRP